MSLKNRISQAVTAKETAKKTDLIDEKRALQTPMISAEEQDWALRLHQKLVKIMDLSLISTMEEKEARIQGVRKINLSDFLSHIGYKPKRRFWAPGMQIPWKLTGGAQSKSVGGTLGNRASSGQVSGAFGKRILTPKTSSGQTSKIFR